MKNLTTSLYAVAHVTNPLFEGALTNEKEYPVFKILENKNGRRIVIIDDNNNMADWDAKFFSFIQKN